jgi:Leucine-rich repeat (LRR) protein
MTRNKLLYITFILVVAITILTGCEPKVIEDTLGLSVSQIKAIPDEKTYTVSVITTASEFSVTSDAAWCGVSADITKKKITIAVTRNSPFSVRTAKVTVSTGQKSAIIQISQAMLEYTANVRDSVALVSLNNGSTKWNTTTPVQTWKGVKMRTIDGMLRVTELDIPALNYVTGSVSDSLKNLTELVYLDLSANNLTGTFPELSALSKLLVLELKNNKISGTVPSLPSTLAYLSMGQNMLSGNLPSHLKNLTMLSVLDVSLNDFTGTIPGDWAILAKLKYLYLYGNKLDGTIPSFIPLLSKLEHLALDYNNLTGTIPAGIGNIPGLKKLYLYQNKLTGNVPSDLLNHSNWLVWREFVVPQQNNNELSSPANVKQLAKKHIQNNTTVKELPDKSKYRSF